MTKKILDQVKFGDGDKRTTLKLEEIIPWKAYKGLSDSKFVEKQYVKDSFKVENLSYYKCSDLLNVSLLSLGHCGHISARSFSSP